MKKKSKKLTLNRETLIQLEDPNLQLAAGGVTLRCDTTPYATCDTRNLSACDLC